MKNHTVRMLALMVVLLGGSPWAYSASEAASIRLFQESKQSAEYFKRSYGYAIFPTIGKGGLGVGAAHGSGHVYERGRKIGRVTMNQLSIGFQAGGQAYSEIIFFKTKDALDDFTSGNFEFAADAGAIAITASVGASVGTEGFEAGASATKHDAATVGGYNRGMAVFTIAKGGLMYNASISGQKFSYRPL
jgi:lipid-binding SYLF domain-containing protein